MFPALELKQKGQPYLRSAVADGMMSWPMKGGETMFYKIDTHVRKANVSSSFFCESFFSAKESCKRADNRLYSIGNEPNQEAP